LMTVAKENDAQGDVRLNIPARSIGEEEESHG
jgi:hypothetical protein